MAVVGARGVAGGEKERVFDGFGREVWGGEEDRKRSSTILSLFCSQAATELEGFWQSKTTKKLTLRTKDVQSSVANRASPK